MKMPSMPSSLTKRISIAIESSSNKIINTCQKLNLNFRPARKMRSRRSANNLINSTCFKTDTAERLCHSRFCGLSSMRRCPFLSPLSTEKCLLMMSTFARCILLIHAAFYSRSFCSPAWNLVCRFSSDTFCDPISEPSLKCCFTYESNINKASRTFALCAVNGKTFWYRCAFVCHRFVCLFEANARTASVAYLDTWKKASHV